MQPLKVGHVFVYILGLRIMLLFNLITQRVISLLAAVNTHEMERNVNGMDDSVRLVVIVIHEDNFR